jgi:sortase A
LTRSDPRRRSLGRAGGGSRAWIGLFAALTGGVLLTIAAAQWLEGVVAQAFARSSDRRSETSTQTAAAKLRELPVKAWSPTAATPEPGTAPLFGDIVARIRIPRAGMDYAVFEGVSADILRKGPGHVPGTALPTSGSNCVITGHRDSFFRRLADVHVGDRVFLSTTDGDVREYRLASRRIVLPTETSVLAPTDGEQVTLVTCYPFRWIGPAPYRVVWQALPVASLANSAQGPPIPDTR